MKKNTITVDKMFDLTGKRALITGSSRGIGFALAKGLGQAGVRLIINGRNLDELEIAKNKLLDLGYCVKKLSFDVRNHEEVKNKIDFFESEIGQIDILINNAGIQHRQKLENFDHLKFNDVIATNLTAVFNVAQAVSPYMIKRKKGKIINIASVMTRLARGNVSAYTTSKAGVGGLTKAMTAEWAKYGINCNAIGPGYFATELTKPLFSDQEFSNWLKNRTPAGRWGEVEELVGAAIFLSSPASEFVNGHVLYVDGGMTVTV